MTGRFRRLALAVAAAALTAVVPAALGPANAQPAQADPEQPGTSQPRLTVDSLRGTLRPGDDVELVLTVENRGTDALEEGRIGLTLERRTRTRLDYQQAVDGGGRRSSVGALSVEVPATAPGATARVEVTRPPSDLGLGGIDDATQGVYPLRVTLESDEGTLDEVRTSVVALTDLVGPEVLAALAVPLDGPVGLRADGVADGDPLAGGLGPEGRLPGIAEALADGPQVPLTVATDALVLEEASAAADGYTATDAAGRIQVGPRDEPARRAAGLVADVRDVLARPDTAQVALPYAQADLVALVRAGGELGDAAATALEQGAERSAEVTGDRPLPGVLWPPDSLDAATLAMAAAQGTDTVILDPEDVGAGEQDAAGLTPSPVRVLEAADGSRVTALVSDPWLGPLLAVETAAPPAASTDGGEGPAAASGGEGPAAASGAAGGAPGPAVAAQRVLAETAALYFERPFETDTRGVLLAPPSRWDASPAALGALLAGLDAAPWLRPVTVDALARAVRPADEPVRLTYPAESRAAELDPPYLAEVAEAAEAAEPLDDVLVDAEDTSSQARRLLQVATSVDFRAAERREDGLELVGVVDQAAQRLLSSVEVVRGPQFTLTDRRGQIPVTLRNTAEAALRVRARLVESPRFATDPDDAGSAERILAPGETTRITFDVEALTPGATAPIDVVVTSVDGAQVLARGQIVVRSTGYSVAALVITAGAGAFLAGWWVRDVRRRRRARAETPDREPDPVPV